jgi:hypothetical protein
MLRMPGMSGREHDPVAARVEPRVGAVELLGAQAQVAPVLVEQRAPAVAPDPYRITAPTTEPRVAASTAPGNVIPPS